MTTRACILAISSVLCGAAALCYACTPTIGISGSPGAPTNVALFQDYEITLTETTTSPDYTGTLFLVSSGSAFGPWAPKGWYTLSGGSDYGQHTWTCENQDTGTYYWKGEGDCTGWGPFGVSPVYGGYTTP